MTSDDERDTIWHLQNGELPVVTEPDISLRKGEVLHAKLGMAWFVQKPIGKTQPPGREGYFYVTNKRLILRTDMETKALRYADIVSVRRPESIQSDAFLIERPSGGNIVASCSKNDLAIALLNEVIARANQ